MTSGYWMSIEQSIFQVQSMANVLLCIDKWSPVKYSGVSRLTSNPAQGKQAHCQAQDSRLKPQNSFQVYYFTL